LLTEGWETDEVINDRVLNEIVCPIGKQKLVYEGDFLTCTKCGARFPVKDGIPVLLAEEAVLPDGVNSVNELECMKK
jgi:uncharacterized protein YbaR (Trm112 family)